MAGVFDFAPDSHVAEEIPPEEVSTLTMNGWEFTAKPNTPYRAKLKITMSGMRWYLNNGSLDVTTDPTINAGRLLNFYKLNRRWDNFSYNHEYLGTIQCRFAAELVIPKAIPNSRGLIADFEVMLVHHNPSFT